MELDFGGESGSERMQQFVCKDVTADEILTSVENLRRWAPSIDPFVSWLSGLPGETYADMEQTFDLMDAMERANPRTQHYGIFMYTPFPSPLLESLPPEFTPPQSLEEWGGIEVFHFLPPWHSKAYVEKLRSISAVTRYAFYPQSRIDEHGWAFKAGYARHERARRATAGGTASSASRVELQTRQRRRAEAPRVPVMSRVALVFPYFRTRSATEMLFPPLGAASLAAQLRELGIETRVFDCTFGSFAQLRDELCAYRPDVVGVYSMVSLTRNALRVAGMVREYLPDSLLVAGGPLPTVFPRRYASGFDAVFRGEADVSFPHFCRDYFERGATPATLTELRLETYAGLFVSAPGLELDNPTAHHSESEIAAFPLPDRSHFDHAAYQREWLEKTGAKTTSIILTLGCPYGCEFCSKPVFGNVVRRRPLDVVFAEIEEIRALGYDSLWIADDTFTLDGPYLEEFCRRIAQTGLAWSCLSRADGITTETVRLMRQAGCRRVHLGLESGSDATLRLMKKHITVADGANAARLYREAGIEVAAFFIVGYPGGDRRLHRGDLRPGAGAAARRHLLQRANAAAGLGALRPPRRAGRGQRLDA